MGTFSSVFASSNIPHHEYCPAHDIYDSERSCCIVCSPSLLVYYPTLFPGDRVARGPDWQWGNQGNGEEGEVMEIKSWKGKENCAVRVIWDNGDHNVYRYGAEHCYDVILCVCGQRFMSRVNPMLHDDFVPDGGLDAWSEGSRRKEG